MLDNWQRLERVVKWTGLSVNAFAMTIGLKRSENLYQIKKGNNGISRDLAELIAKKYPSISRGWLLSGEGDMFIGSRGAATGVPFYSMDAIDAVRGKTKLPDPRFLIDLPIFAECDLAAACVSAAMQPDIPSGSIVMLKETSVANLIPGETYVIISPRFNGIRVVRQTNNAGQLLLLPRNTAEYDPFLIEQNKITKLYQVCGVIHKVTV